MLYVVPCYRLVVHRDALCVLKSQGNYTKRNVSRCTKHIERLLWVLLFSRLSSMDVKNWNILLHNTVPNYKGIISPRPQLSSLQYHWHHITLEDWYIYSACAYRFCKKCIYESLMKANEGFPICRQIISTRRRLREDRQCKAIVSNYLLGCDTIFLVIF